MLKPILSQFFPLYLITNKGNDANSQRTIEVENPSLSLTDGIEKGELLRIIDENPCIIFTAIHDQTRSINFMSEGCFHLTGYHAHELIIPQQNFYDSLIHPEDLSEILEVINDAITQQISYEIEYRIKTKSNQEKWFWEKGRCINDPSEEIKQLEGYIVDITSFKQLEQDLRESRERYRLLAENTTDLITLHNPDGNYNYISPVYQSLLGYPLDTILHTMYDSLPCHLCHPDDKCMVKDFYEELKTDAYLGSIVYRMRHCNGNYIWIETNAKVIPDPETGEIEKILCVSRDITKRKQVEEALQQASYQYRNIFDHVTQGIFQTSKEGHYLTANPALAKLYGYDSPADLINRLLYIDQQLYVDPQRRATLMRLLEEKGSVINFESQVYRKDGSVIWISENTRAVYDQRENFLYYEGTVEDITYRRQAEAKLFQAAYHDPLTKLPNRLWFTNQFESCINQFCEECKPFYAVLFLDLDGFKRVNESLGHYVGDELIKMVAHRLKSSLREVDKVARFGGDKFVILLVDQIESTEEIIQVTERILQRFRVPFHLENETLFMGVSIGITTCKIGYQKTEDVLRDAEIAMYQAKASGKNCYVIFNQAMQISALSRLQLESDLRNAIEEEEFILYYQPIVRLETGKLTGFEALIRWYHPQKGWISPVDFIPVAEETGLINVIGWWVMEEACCQLKKWQKTHPSVFPLTMNINFSMYQLTQKDLVKTIKNLLEKTEVSGEQIKLEITESCFLETLASDLEKVEQIKQLGIGLCIDDFGTGYSSLNRLHEFPIDTLKIDRTFTQRLDSHPTTIVPIIVNLAHTLGMTVVAEGIETSQQLEHLKTLGCEHGQGYLFSPPVNEETACQFFKKDYKNVDFLT